MLSPPVPYIFQSNINLTDVMRQDVLKESLVDNLDVDGLLLLGLELPLPLEIGYFVSFVVPPDLFRKI